MKINIKHNVKLSEFEIQAELYYRIKELGFNIRGEVSCFYSENRVTNKARFDLLVLDKDNNPKLIIEVKKRSQLNLSIRESKQMEKYKITGLECIYCLGQSNIDNCINNVIDYMDRR